MINMKNKILWSLAIVGFLGIQVGVGIGYYTIADHMNETIQ